MFPSPPSLSLPSAQVPSYPSLRLLTRSQRVATGCSAWWPLTRLERCVCFTWMTAERAARRVRASPSRRWPRKPSGYTCRQTTGGRGESADDQMNRGNRPDTPADGQPGDGESRQTIRWAAETVRIHLQTDNRGTGRVGRRSDGPRKPSGYTCRRTTGGRGESADDQMGRGNRPDTPADGQPGDGESRQTIRWTAETVRIHLQTDNRGTGRVGS